MANAYNSVSSTPSLGKRFRVVQLLNIMMCAAFVSACGSSNTDLDTALAIERKFQSAYDSRTEGEAVAKLRSAINPGEGMDCAIRLFGDEQGTAIDAAEAFRRLRESPRTQEVYVEVVLTEQTFFSRPDHVHSFKHRLIEDSNLTGLLGE